MWNTQNELDEKYKVRSMYHSMYEIHNSCLMEQKKKSDDRERFDGEPLTK